MGSSGARPEIDPVKLSRLATVRGVPLRRIDVIAETGSTNADLLELAATGQPIDGVVIVTGHQTAGRGRNGRRWNSIPGAQVAMSVGIRVDAVPSQAWGWIPLVAGLAVADAAFATVGARVGLKWPNDVLAKQHPCGKVAGVLAELSSAATGAVVVVGLGINVAHGADELPDPGATSLALVGGHVPAREDVVVAVLAGLIDRVSRLASEGGATADLIAEYTARSLTVGSRVRAILPGGREEVGVAERIDESGRLILGIGDRSLALSAGDIVHLRR